MPEGEGYAGGRGVCRRERGMPEGERYAGGKRGMPEGTHRDGKGLRLTGKRRKGRASRRRVVLPAGKTLHRRRHGVFWFRPWQRQIPASSRFR